MTKLEPASAMMAMIAEDACSMEGIGGDNPCCGYGSWIRARRWSPVVAAADAVANSETEMPPRSSARGRLSSSAASTRFGPKVQVERRERSVLARFSNSLECTGHGN